MGNTKNRKRNRLPYFDYSQNGYYFVTICTYGKAEMLGTIENGKMKLSNIGIIVEHYWLEIPKHFKNVGLDEYVIMPNHIHGIVINSAIVGNAHVRSLHGNDRTKMLIPKIIHGFKSSVTRQINKMQKTIRFRWQKSFHDHIIRGETDLYRIRQYIRNNPAQWTLDRNYLRNL